MQETTIEFNEQGYIHVLIRGPLDLDGIQRYAGAIVQLGERHSCKRLLADLTGAEVKVSASELFIVLFKLSEQGLNRSWRRAILVVKTMPIVEIFQEIALERLFPTKTFTDIEKAKSWLLG